MNVRVLVVDDNPEFLRAASVFLALLPDVEVVGLATKTEEAILQAFVQSPDAVLIDLGLLGTRRSFTTRLKSIIRPPNIIVMSFAEGPEYELATIRAGADAYITKADFTDRINEILFARVER